MARQPVLQKTIEEMATDLLRRYLMVIALLSSLCIVMVLGQLILLFMGEALSPDTLSKSPPEEIQRRIDHLETDIEQLQTALDELEKQLIDPREVRRDFAAKIRLDIDSVVDQLEQVEQQANSLEISLEDLFKSMVVINEQLHRKVPHNRE